MDSMCRTLDDPARLHLQLKTNKDLFTDQLLKTILNFRRLTPQRLLKKYIFVRGMVHPNVYRMSGQTADAIIEGMWDAFELVSTLFSR